MRRSLSHCQKMRHYDCCSTQPLHAIAVVALMLLVLLVSSSNSGGGGIGCWAFSNNSRNNIITLAAATKNPSRVDSWRHDSQGLGVTLTRAVKDSSVMSAPAAGATRAQQKQEEQFASRNFRTLKQELFAQTAVISNDLMAKTSEHYLRPDDDAIARQHQQRQQERESSPESSFSARGNGGSDDDDNADDDTDRIRRQAQTALLLGKNRGTSGNKPKKATKPAKTSVGERRTKGATRARQQPLAATKLTQALRQTARSAAAAPNIATQPPQDNGNGDGAMSNKANDNITSPSSSQISISPLAVHAAVDQLLQAQQPTMFQPWKNDRPKVLSAAFSSVGRLTSIGVLGEVQNLTTERQQQQPQHGASTTVVTTAATSKSLYHPGATILETNQIEIRAAIPMDDVPVANLRLSVFSHFSPSQQGQFCARSCQAIASRRMRGACCIIATSNPQKTISSSSSSSPHQHHPPPYILGSAECSYHEFFGTRLGSRRPQFSLLYVTEVAVQPTARRRGIGLLLLQGIDVLARSRSVETLYLHVDVTNEAAIALYERAGYRKVAEKKKNKRKVNSNDIHDGDGVDDDLYREFTKSLDLHPGATKGRKHFLLYKHLTPNPTWLEEPEECSLFADDRTSVVSRLGFEIPA